MKRYIMSKRYFVAVVGIFIGISMALLIMDNYRTLRDGLISNEQDYLLTLADSTAKSLESYLNAEKKSLTQLTQEKTFLSNFESWMRGETVKLEDTSVGVYYYLEFPRINYIELFDIDGKVIGTYTKDKEEVTVYPLTQEELDMISTVEHAVVRDTFFEGSSPYVHVMQPVIKDGEHIGSVRIKLNVNYMYDTFVASIKSGSKGYASVKDSSGRFLMHPNKSQVGKDVLALRKEKYPDFDWSELETLFGRQMRKESGAEVYHSVWVTEEEPERVLKFNGYVPATVGDDFWIVTVSADYDEVVSIIRDNYYKTVFIAALIFLSIFASFIFVYISKQKEEKLTLNTKHLEEVKVLNAELEEDLRRRKLEEEAVRRSEQRFIRIASQLASDDEDFTTDFIGDEDGETRLSASKLERINRQLEVMFKKEMDENKRKEALMMQQSRYVAMGEMIGNIAHQWRQPLNALSVMLSNFEDMVTDEEYDKDYLQSMFVKSRKLISKMSMTIDDFRYFFKPRTKKSAFNVFESIIATSSLCEERIRFHGVVFKVLGDKEMTIVGYANQLSQVVLNLINNAIDAFQEADNNDKQILVVIRREDEKCVVEFADNAGGIPLDLMDQIFDPYVTTKDMKNGTGLGLYMSKMIIEQNFNGSIEVANRNGGACFRLIMASGEENESYDRTVVDDL